VGNFWNQKSPNASFSYVENVVADNNVLLGPAFELPYSTLPNGIVAVEISPPATSPMSSPRFKGTMLMDGLTSTIDVPVLASAAEQRSQ
jgi:hypothetical protein